MQSPRNAGQTLVKCPERSTTCMQSAERRADAAASDRAVHQLREEILGGEYVPGDRLGEVELAEPLGVSRTPVREALRRLAAEGLVEQHRQPGRPGGRVPAEELRRIFEIRARVEGAVAPDAAEPATDGRLDRLRALATVLKEHSGPAGWRSCTGSTASSTACSSGWPAAPSLHRAPQPLIHARCWSHLHLPRRAPAAAASPTTSRSSPRCGPATATGPRRSCARTCYNARATLLGPAPDRRRL